MNSEKKLHILFLSSWYPSRVFETHGNFVQKHAQAIALKHNVSVVYPVGDTTKKGNDLEIFDTTNDGVREIIIYFKRHQLPIINAKRKYKALLKGLKMIEKFDIIHGNVLFPIGLLAVKIKKKYKVPLVFTEHWTGYLPENKNHISRIKKIIITYIIKNTQYIIPVSKTLKEAMIKMGFKSKFTVIGNAIDTTIFKPAKKENKILKILHISYLNDKQKNVRGLLKVIKKLSTMKIDFRLDIIGDGSHHEIVKLIKQLSLPKNIVFLHKTKNTKEVACFMQKANLYISFSNYETFGVVLIEALACGTPVISTKTGILTELKQQPFVYLIPINDRKMLLKQILKFNKHKPSFDLNNLHQFVASDFSFVSISNQYSCLYYKILANE